MSHTQDARRPAKRDAAPRRPADPLGTPARRAALRLLDAVLRRGEALEAALPAATRAVHGPDRGLAHAIAAEALRRLGDLDALIDGATRQRLPDDAKARMALRIALAQTLALGTPPHAAIATVLPLVDGGPRKLVHGVFGTVMRAGATLPEAATLPEVVAARWQAAWGEEMVAGAALALATQPPTDLSLADASATEEWCGRLSGTSLATGSVRLASGHAPVPELPGFAEGGWWVQDLAASLPARLLADVSGSTIDLCAAPGGKTLQLAASGKAVTAVDVSKSRLARLRDNLTRTGLSATVVTADVLEWSPAEPADAVLVDAPCSATGIFRRHPDVLYRAHAGIIAEMAELQARILARAADWVRPGGVMVFATCSLEPEEGEEQLDAFLAARPDYRLDRIADRVPEALRIAVRTRGDGEHLRTLPGILADKGGCDGFFIARLTRVG